jgi:THO complex subunit 2
MSLMPEYYCLTNSEEICRNIATLISVAIDPLYRQNSGLSRKLASKLRPFHAPHVRYFTPITTIAQFVESVVPIITFLGPFMYVDVLLIVKLVRLFKTFFRRVRADHRKRVTGTVSSEGAEAGELVPSVATGKIIDDDVMEVDSEEGQCETSPELQTVMLNILDDGILQAVSLVESNCGLSEELWQLLKHLRYETRYRLYHGWKKDPTNSLLMKKRAGTLKKIKWIMKRLSKENIKLSGRQIGKLSHSNPSFLFDNVSTEFSAPTQMLLRLSGRSL